MVSSINRNKQTNKNLSDKTVFLLAAYLGVARAKAWLLPLLQTTGSKLVLDNAQPDVSFIYQASPIYFIFSFTFSSSIAINKMKEIRIICLTYKGTDPLQRALENNDYA